MGTRGRKWGRAGCRGGGGGGAQHGENKRSRCLLGTWNPQPCVQSQDELVLSACLLLTQLLACLLNMQRHSSPQVLSALS